MPAYKADLIDIEFNLFEILKIQESNSLGMDISSLKDILYQFEKFTRLEIYPTRVKSDVEGVKLVDDRVVSPESLRNLHKSYYENGWYALGQPEKYSGAPVPEALHLACISLANGANTAYMMYPGLSKAAMNVIRLQGEEWMKKVFIPPMMEGKWGGTMCLTEPGAGSDVGALRTTAVQNNDGTWSIKGTKIFISTGNSDLYENSIHLVLARTPQGGQGTKGISLFIVPKIWVNKDGITGEGNDAICTKVEEKMGIHASATCELQFGSKGNCRGYLIGKEFEGMSTMFIMMNEARLLCSLQGEGQANLSFEMSKSYAQERSQFGKEIIHHPDIKRMLLKMRANCRAMRQLSLYTANLFDLEKNDHKYADLIGLLTPICKAHFTDQALLTSVDAVQIHGGYGFCKEYEVEQFVRDTIIGKIYEGTNGIQAIDFTMRKVLKDKAKTLLWLADLMISDINKLPEMLVPEKNLWLKCLQSTQQVVQLFSEKSLKNDFDFVLYYSSDFLKICSALIHGWQLSISAHTAIQKTQEAKGTKEQAQYWDSKVADLQVYVAVYINEALFIAEGIKNTKLDFWKFNI